MCKYIDYSIGILMPRQHYRIMLDFTMVTMAISSFETKPSRIIIRKEQNVNNYYSKQILKLIKLPLLIIIIHYR